MNKITRYEVRIKGTSPVIWNVMKRELQLELKQLKKDELSEWEENPKNWQRKAELDDKDNVIIPDRWFKSALVESCKKNRIVPHYATRKNETYSYYVQSFMIFNKGKPVCKKTQLEPYGAFVGAQGKNSNTKVWRVRPKLNEWTATFEILDTSGRMKLEELEETCGFAGMMVGLGDNRINNFGRFEVEKIIRVD